MAILSMVSVPTDYRLPSARGSYGSRRIDSSRIEKASSAQWETGNSEFSLSTNSREQKRVGSLVEALKACTRRRDLEKGRKLHAEIIEAGLDTSSMYVASSLVNMYAKCGSLEEAHDLLNKLPPQDAVPWNAIMFAHLQNGDGASALKLFKTMQAEKCQGSTLTYVAAIRACGILAAKERQRTKQIKPEVIKTGISIHHQAERLIKSRPYNMKERAVLASSLVDMYAACGRMQDARRVFESLPRKDVVLWNNLILGYAENQQGEEALELLVSMQRSRENCKLNSRTFVAALKACSAIAAQEEGSRTYGRFVKLKSVGNALIHMYAESGSIADAQEVFNRMERHDVVSWNSLIMGYAENGDSKVALELFALMQSEGVTATPPTYLAAFKACRRLAEADELRGGSNIQRDDWPIKFSSLEKVMLIHAHAPAELSSTFLATTMVDAYAMCGSMTDARMVFDKMAARTVVSWNTILSGYVENGKPEEALALLSCMESEGCSPDERTFVAAIKACAALAEKEQHRMLDGRLVKINALEKGMAIHSQMRSLESMYALSSLVDMYSKCGSMQDARRVFSKMAIHDEAAWTAILNGYAENRLFTEAVDFIVEMGDEGLPCDAGVLCAALKICAGVGAVEIGRELHAELCRCGFECDAAVVTCIVEFYGKCGDTASAQFVFDSTRISRRNVITWTALMNSYGRLGNVEKVVELFRSVLNEELEPTNATFLAILNACNRAGLVDQGLNYLDRMQSQFGIRADVVHFDCVVDMLGRANRLHEAVAMVESLPIEPKVLSWMTLLTGCSKWKNVKVGKAAFDKLMLLDEMYEPAYQAMANIYASAGMRLEKSLIDSRLMHLQESSPSPGLS